MRQGRDFAFRGSLCRKPAAAVSIRASHESAGSHGHAPLAAPKRDRYGAHSFFANKSPAKNGTNIRCSSKKRGEAKRTQTPAGTAVNVRPRRSGSDEEAHALPAESEVLFTSPIGSFKKKDWRLCAKCLFR